MEEDVDLDMLHEREAAIKQLEVKIEFKGNVPVNFNSGYCLLIKFHVTFMRLTVCQTKVLPKKSHISTNTFFSKKKIAAFR